MCTGIHLWFFIPRLMFVGTSRSVLTQSSHTAVVQVQIPADIMGHREASEPAVRIDPSSWNKTLRSVCARWEHVAIRCFTAEQNASRIFTSPSVTSVCVCKRERESLSSPLNQTPGECSGWMMTAVLMLNCSMYTVHSWDFLDQIVMKYTLSAWNTVAHNAMHLDLMRDQRFFDIRQSQQSVSNREDGRISGNLFGNTNQKSWAVLL